MRIYLTTDTHFYHSNMIKYCKRPIGFTEIVGLNLLDVGFKEDDVLIHLGDICIGFDQKVHDLYIKPLKCKKWLVKGNHEHKSDNWYLNNGWDFVCKRFENKYFGKNILFSHSPQEDNGFDFNIHGHFHNTLFRLLQGNWIVEDEKERNEKDLKVLTKKHKLLALEYTDYKPVLLEHFLEQSNPTPKEEEAK